MSSITARLNDRCVSFAGSYNFIIYSTLRSVFRGCIVFCYCRHLLFFLSYSIKFAINDVDVAFSYHQPLSACLNSGIMSQLYE